MSLEQRADDRDRSAARIGARYGRNAIFVGLACAALILGQLSDDPFTGLFRMIEDAPLQAAICLVGGPIVGHFFGAWAGRVIMLKGWNAFGTCVLIGFGSVLSITILFSLVALGSEGMGSDAPWTEVLLDYVGKPIYWTSVFGAPVIVLVAAIMAMFFVRARRSRFASGSLNE